jgi:hypothetical protein
LGFEVHLQSFVSRGVILQQIIRFPLNFSGCVFSSISAVSLTCGHCWMLLPTHFSWSMCRILFWYLWVPPPLSSPWHSILFPV